MTLTEAVAELQRAKEEMAFAEEQYAIASAADHAALERRRKCEEQLDSARFNLLRCVEGSDLGNKRIYLYEKDPQEQSAKA